MTFAEVLNPLLPEAQRKQEAFILHHYWFWFKDWKELHCAVDAASKRNVLKICTLPEWCFFYDRSHPDSVQPWSLSALAALYIWFCHDPALPLPSTHPAHYSAEAQRERGHTSQSTLWHTVTRNRPTLPPLLLKVPKLRPHHMILSWLKHPAAQLSHWLYVNVLFPLLVLACPSLSSALLMYWCMKITTD